MGVLHWLGGRRIFIKVMLAPISVAALTVALAGAASYSAQRQGRVLVGFGQVLLPRTDEINHVLDAAMQAHTDLFRGVTWAANSDEPAKVTEFAGRSAKSLDLVEASLDGLAQHWDANQDATPIFAAARSAVARYRVAAGRVLTMASVDPTTAFIMLFQAEKQFESMRGSLEALRNDLSQRSARTLADALAGQQRLRFGLFVLLAAGCCWPLRSPSSSGASSAGRSCA